MAATYYTTNDLLYRRVMMAKWICIQTRKFVNQICYGELIDSEEEMNFQYMVALLEAVECYTPITLAAEDGVDNCLTEAKLDSVFENVTTITGLHFMDVESTYHGAAEPETNTTGNPIDIGGGTWTTEDDNTVGQSTPPIGAEPQGGPEPFDP